jgi:hypothetical protein
MKITEIVRKLPTIVYHDLTVVKWERDRHVTRDPTEQRQILWLPSSWSLPVRSRTRTPIAIRPLPDLATPGQPPGPGRHSVRGTVTSHESRCQSR